MADSKAHQKNSPEVEHRLDNPAVQDAHAEAQDDLEASLAAEREQFDAAQDRARAMAAPIQKVLDGNEAAALATITGSVPVRDMSEAPKPAPLGIRHSE